MKLDLTRLPVGEAIIGFLVVVLAVTFTGAFIAKSGGESGGGAAVSASPSPVSSATPEAATPAPGGGGGQELILTMGDNFFQLDSEKNPNLRVKAGSTVTIRLTNKGTAIHNMRIAGEDNTYNNKDDAVSDPQLVTAGQSAKLEWKAPSKTGDYNYQCDFHPTDMKGIITVE